MNAQGSSFSNLFIVPVTKSDSENSSATDLVGDLTLKTTSGSRILTNIIPVSTTWSGPASAAALTTSELALPSSLQFPMVNNGTTSYVQGCTDFNCQPVITGGYEQICASSLWPNCPEFSDYPTPSMPTTCESGLQYCLSTIMPSAVQSELSERCSSTPIMSCILKNSSATECSTTPGSSWYDCLSTIIRPDICPGFPGPYCLFTQYTAVPTAVVNVTAQSLIIELVTATSGSQTGSITQTHIGQQTDSYGNVNLTVILPAAAVGIAAGGGVRYAIVKGVIDKANLGQLQKLGGTIKNLVRFPKLSMRLSGLKSGGGFRIPDIHFPCIIDCPSGGDPPDLDLDIGGGTPVVVDGDGIAPGGDGGGGGDDSGGGGGGPGGTDGGGDNPNDGGGDGNNQPTDKPTDSPTDKPTDGPTTEPTTEPSSSASRTSSSSSSCTESTTISSVRIDCYPTTMTSFMNITSTSQTCYTTTATRSGCDLEPITTTITESCSRATTVQDISILCFNTSTSGAPSSSQTCITSTSSVSGCNITPTSTTTTSSSSLATPALQAYVIVPNNSSALADGRDEMTKILREIDPTTFWMAKATSINWIAMWYQILNDTQAKALAKDPAVCFPLS